LRREWMAGSMTCLHSRGHGASRSARSASPSACGRADTLVPAAHGDWLAAHIPGIDVMVTDAGHLGDDATVEAEMAWLAGRT
jgi:hypothetical protein